MRILLATLFLCLSTALLAQQTNRVAVVLTNGNEYIGTIEKDDGREIYLMTINMGGIFLLKTEIRSIKPITSDKQIVEGEFRNTGPFTTRYAFTTNALSINKGENYTMLNLYGPEMHMAVSNRLSVGIMSTWIGSPLILALKYTIPTKNPNVNFSLGNLTATSGYLQSFRGFGNLAFGNVTFGNRLNNITFAGGYFMYRGGGLENYNQAFSVVTDQYGFDYNENKGLPKPVHGPMFSIGGIARIGAKASFVFDSMLGFFEHEYGEFSTTTLSEPVYSPNDPWLLITPGQYQHQVTMKKTNSSVLFVMPGMRFQRDERKAFQFNLAGIMVSDSGDSFSAPFPMCTWFYRF
jgi:hypothetical protein